MNEMPPVLPVPRWVVGPVLSQFLEELGAALVIQHFILHTQGWLSLTLTSTVLTPRANSGDLGSLT